MSQREREAQTGETGTVLSLQGLLPPAAQKAGPSGEEAGGKGPAEAFPQMEICLEWVRSAHL